jgi:hypothetical protein
MRVIIVTVPLAIVLASGCAPSTSRLNEPAPCVGNDSTYTSDAVGVTAAQPSYVSIPPADVPPGIYRVSVLVDAQGSVIGDSIKVLEAPSETGAHRIARTVAQYRYRPGVRNGCAVRFRTEVAIRR